jgi:hypothetical protein
MMRNGNRTIKVNKSNLIDKVKENKANHIKQYEEAKVAYRHEAAKQLRNLKKELNDGDLDLELKLVTPVDNSKNYDDIVDMFQWEEDNLVELSQSEFTEYIQDKTSFANEARFSNTYYSG